MKSGDMVNIVGAFASDTVGILIQKWGVDNPDWWEIMVGEEIIHWPECQLKLASSQKMS